MIRYSRRQDIESSLEMMKQTEFARKGSIDRLSRGIPTCDESNRRQGTMELR